MWPSFYHNYLALERILEKLSLRRRGKSITPKKLRLESDNQHMASLWRSNSTSHWYGLTALSPLHSPPLQQVAELYNVRICNNGEFYKKTETGIVDRGRTHLFSLFSLLFALFRWSSLSRFSAFLQHALSRGDRHLSKEAKVSLLESTFTRTMVKPGKRLWEATHSLFKCFTNVRDCAPFSSPFSQWQQYKTTNKWLVAASNTGIYIISDLSGLSLRFQGPGYIPQVGGESNG